jgi:protease II
MCSSSEVCTTPHSLPAHAQVPVPSWATHLAGGANQDFHSPSLRLSCSSPIHPDTSFDFRLASASLHHLSTQQVSSGRCARTMDRVPGQRSSARKGHTSVL